MKFITFSILLAAAAVIADQPRTFTDTQGREITATVLGFTDTEVQLQRSDGMIFDLDPELLSDADRSYLAELREAEKNKHQKVNQAAGHDLFSSKSLLERPASEIAEALGMRPESTADGLLSWRLYAAFHPPVGGGEPGAYRLFGALPFSLAVYADADGTFGQLSAVYANKGDFGSTAGFGRSHFSSGGSAPPKTLEEAMRRDFDAVTERLTQALGEPSEQRFGEGKARRTVERWNWGHIAILLALEEEEFVSLSIVAAELADSGGKTERIDDTSLKRRLADSIIRADNGDVLIHGIPMVNQGPKGYCVPATFERAMRFMGVDADMYLLAMVGQSSSTGGTSPRLLIEEVKSQIYRKARRTREDDMRKLSVSRLDRFIDDGVPVMWTMYSLDEYNDLADANTKARAEVEDWDAWAAKIAEQSETFSGREPTPGNNHICMIVGYNAETDELAVSDSWGPHFELRWIPVALANWVHGGELFMILP